jgi:maltooligosyltrehalose trehalohydrolase
VPGGKAHFRVWAPRCRRVEVVFDGKPGSLTLEPEGDGYFAGLAPRAGAGTLYRVRLDGGDPLPDPASRFQPDGPHGPSQVVDPSAFRWSDAAWPGLRLDGQILYEIHVGTFTPEGTWAAAEGQLPALKDLGITAVEVMPVAAFPGAFNWGYDGVDLFAPTRNYGEPDDFRHFVDEAHRIGMGVILDVVYNHLGPDGNHLKAFSDRYFSTKHVSEWGETFNWDDEGNGPVREFFLANVAHWIAEYHLDGLRFDATQAFFDDSPEHILTALARRAREAAGDRSVLVIAENEPLQAKIVRPVDEGGYGLDAIWNEDFHHAAKVAVLGRRDGYYHDYRGSPQEFVSLCKRGFLFQGQRYGWQSKRRGSPTSGLAPSRFVNYLQNHDQVANAFGGRRFHEVASPARYRAITALLLLAPGTPLLFQGQDFAATSPFLYFGDHREEIARAMHEGRLKFLQQFRAFNHPDLLATIPFPADSATFRRSKLDPAERARHAWAVDLHRDLLALRRDDPVFGSQRPGALDGAVLGPDAFVLRYFGEECDDRLLVVNFGAELPLEVVPEPLLAPPEGRAWHVVWYSEDPRYGGAGLASVETPHGWILPGQAAVALAPRAKEDWADEEPDA